MDQFYLRNAAWYHTLVDRFEPGPSAGSIDQSGTTSPDMVVSARLRPFLREDITAGFPSAVFPRPTEKGAVDIHDLYNHPRGRPVLKSFKYAVDKLFTPEVSTEEIYQDTVARLIPFAQNGGIGTVFAYGQTGSGKTFTINTLSQLVIESLTSSSSSHNDINPPPHPLIRLTIIELSGNTTFDLLTNRNPISILEDAHGTIHLSGAAEHPISSTAEALSLLDRAASLRRTASTSKNDASSRSHCICRIRIPGPPTSTDNNTKTITTDTSNGTETETQQAQVKDSGLIYLVDLAGSEAARDVATHGADRMRETKEINLSLSVLKDCIRGKAELDAQFRAEAASGAKRKGKKPPARIPFRQSALTKVLKHVFDAGPGGMAGGKGEGRGCMTVVIACVNPSLADVGASKNTLRYAEMLRVLVPVADGKKREGPMGWGNEEVREWIGENCGEPTVSSDILAPTESGADMLRMSGLEFEYRCLKSPGVTREQAEELRSKLWQLHTESK